MELEELVLSIDQMNHLKELGLKVKDTAMCWVEQIYDRCGNLLPKKTFKLEYDKFEISLMNRKSSVTPTLTLQEILELLPDFIEEKCKIPSLFRMRLSKENINYSNAFNYALHDEYGKSMIGNAYNMLCWVLEKGYLKQK